MDGQVLPLLALVILGPSCVEARAAEASASGSLYAVLLEKRSVSVVGFVAK